MTDEEKWPCRLDWHGPAAGLVTQEGVTFMYAEAGCLRLRVLEHLSDIDEAVTVVYRLRAELALGEDGFTRVPLWSDRYTGPVEGGIQRCMQDCEMQAGPALLNKLLLPTMKSGLIERDEVEEMLCRLY